jgi:hypothetical protein
MSTKISVDDPEIPGGGVPTPFRYTDQFHASQLALVFDADGGATLSVEHQTGDLVQVSAGVELDAVDLASLHAALAPAVALHERIEAEAVRLAGMMRGIEQAQDALKVLVVAEQSSAGRVIKLSLHRRSCVHIRRHQPCTIEQAIAQILVGATPPVKFCGTCQPAGSTGKRYEHAINERGLTVDADGRELRDVLAAENPVPVLPTAEQQAYADRVGEAFADAGTPDDLGIPLDERVAASLHLED